MCHARLSHQTEVWNTESLRQMLAQEEDKKRVAAVRDRYDGMYHTWSIVMNMAWMENNNGYPCCVCMAYHLNHNLVS